MLPQTHHLIVNEAIDRAGSWPREFRREILQGNDDEDVIIVPMLQWRLRAAGFTHTYVPREHYGELWFPSAKRQCAVFLDKSNREKKPSRRAWWIGRACHLIGDAIVPARAKRIWHIEGDPLEAWIEEHWEMFRNVSIPEIKDSTPDAIFEQLVQVASTFPVDTTRTPWGRWAMHWFGRGRTIDTDEIEKQSRVLIPLAIAGTKALLEWVNRA